MGKSQYKTESYFWILFYYTAHGKDYFCWKHLKSHLGRKIEISGLILFIVHDLPIFTEIGILPKSYFPYVGCRF